MKRTQIPYSDYIFSRLIHALYTHTHLAQGTRSISFYDFSIAVDSTYGN